MNEDELKQFLEGRGYTVKNIRVFKKVFQSAVRKNKARFERPIVE